MRACRQFAFGVAGWVGPSDTVAPWRGLHHYNALRPLQRHSARHAHDGDGWRSLFEMRKDGLSSRHRIQTQSASRK